MVSKQVNQRKTIVKKRRIKWILSMLLLGVSIAALVVGIGYLITWMNGTATSFFTDGEITTVDSESEPEVVLPEKVDFQPVGGNRSVYIYDLERDEVVGNYNSDEDYGTASLYKLFVVYEGYKRVQNGEWDANDPAGSTGYTILKCLDLAIRESLKMNMELLIQISLG